MVSVTIPEVLNSLRNEIDLHIFPNPANNTLNIAFNNDDVKKANAELINSFGQTLLSVKILQTGITTIDINRIQAGIYYLKVTIDENSILKKVSITK